MPAGPAEVGRRPLDGDAMKPAPMTFETPLGTVRVVRKKPEGGHDATFSVEDMTIEIDPELAPDRARSTFLHEVMHCCFAVYGHVDRWTSAEEERIVGFLEPLLFDILDRNGWLRIPCYGGRKKKPKPRVQIQATFLGATRHPGRGRRSFVMSGFEDSSGAGFARPPKMDMP